MHVHCHRRQARQGVHVRLAPRSRRANERISMHRCADRPDRWWRMMCSLLLGAGGHSSPIHTCLTRATDSSIHRIGQSKAKCFLYVPAAYMPPFSQCSQDGAHDGRRASLYLVVFPPVSEQALLAKELAAGHHRAASIGHAQYYTKETDEQYSMHASMPCRLGCRRC
jgi:hypothetical protein